MPRSPLQRPLLIERIRGALLWKRHRLTNSNWRGTGTGRAQTADDSMGEEFGVSENDRAGRYIQNTFLLNFTVRKITKEG